MTGVLVVQTTTFVALGGMFFATGDWRRGFAQILLGGVTALIYS